MRYRGSPGFPATLCLLVLLGACATLPPPAPIARPVKVTGSEATFPSGLRVLVYRVPTAVRAEVNVSYAVGSIDDPRGKEGLAHLVEHLAFRARHEGPDAAAWQERLLRIGGESNAFTGYDGTDYQLSIPAGSLEAALELEGQRMLDLLANVTDEDFAIERDVVLAEWRLRQEQNAAGKAHDALVRQFDPAHPYARPVGGTLESLRSITLQDARDFVAARYGPERAILVVSGPMPPEQVVELVARKLGRALGDPGLEIEPFAREAPAYPEQLAPAPKELPWIRANVSGPRVYMAFPLPGLHAGRAASARVAERLIGEMVGGHLWEDPRVIGVDSYVTIEHGLSTVVVVADVRREADAAGVAERMGNQLRAVAYARMTAPRLYGRAYAQLQTGTYLNLEHLPLASAANFLRAHGNPDYIGGWLDQVKRAFPKGPDLFLEKYLVRERARYLVVAPLLEGGGSEADGGAAARRTEQPREPEELDASTLGDVVRVSGVPGFARARTFELPSGLRVMTLRREGMPVIDVRLVQRTPPITAKEARGALPTLATVASWSSRQTVHAGFIGARTVSSVTQDGIVFGATASSGNLTHVLDDIGRWVRRKDLFAPVFENVRGKFVAELAGPRGATSRQQVAHAAALYGAEHPYGLQADAKACRDVGQGSAGRYLSRALQPRNATLVLVGDLPPDEEVERHVKDWLGGWRGSREAPALDQPQSPRPASPVVLVESVPGATQTTLEVGLRLERLMPEDLATLDVLTTLLEDRLTARLREQEGATYDVQVRDFVRPAATAVTVRTTVPTAHTAHALGVVASELAALRTAEGTGEPRVTASRWRLARAYAGRFDTASGIAAHFQYALAMGWSPTLWDRYPEQLARVDGAAIRALAQRLGLETPVVSMVGEPTTLMTAAGALGKLVPGTKAPRAVPAPAAGPDASTPAVPASGTMP